MSASAQDLPASGLPIMPIRISMDALRTTYILTILLSTLLTLVPASGLTGDEPNYPLTALAAVETVAIIGFAFESWRLLAALILVLVFVIAFVASAIFGGEIAARFILFGACAIYLQGPSSKARRKEQMFA